MHSPGGENIYPLEIEERLGKHPAVLQSSIVGLKDKRYGEAVAAFLELRPGHSKPTDKEVSDWVRLTLGHHKAPTYVFWLGQGEIPQTLPMTGSGKIQKNKLRDLGNLLITKSKL
jgi:acyl-CoA synthetase (AMP-forming)/AMP-acid ligase II